MGLRTRLMLAFMVVLTPLVFVVTHQQIAFFRLTKNAQSMNDHAAPLLEAVVELQEIAVRLTDLRIAAEGWDKPAVVQARSELEGEIAVIANLCEMEATHRQIGVVLKPRVDEMLEALSRPEFEPALAIVARNHFTSAVREEFDREIEHVRRDQADLQAISSRARRITGVALLVLITCAAFFSHSTANWVVGRVIVLKRAVSRLKAGDYSVSIQTDKPDEFGELVADFKGLSESLRRSVVSRSFFQSILDSMSDGVIVVDTSERVSYVNSRFSALWGKEITDGAAISDVFDESWMADLARDGAAKVSSAPPRALGDRILTLGRAPLIGSDGPLDGFIYVLRDVTEQQMLSRLLATQRDQLERNERISAIGTLGAIVAHKLSQPLSSVKLFLQQSVRALKSVPQTPLLVQENLERSLSELTTISETVKTLIRAGRARPEIEDRSVDVCESARRVSQTLREFLERNAVEIHLDLPRSTAAAQCSEIEMDEMLYSLITNSVHAAHGRDDCVIRVGVEEDGGFVLVSVEDNSSGIPPEHLDSIFDCFFTTKAEGHGTGLGLAIVKHIAERHGGTVSVTSAVGSGTTFVLRMMKREGDHDGKTADSIHC